MRSLTVAGLDLGTSGKSAITVLRGADFNLTCLHSEAISSINPVDLEARIEVVHGHYSPELWIMELNGPGAVFSGYMERNRPHIPLATVDVSLAPPEEDIRLWDDAVRISNREFLNVRAAMYWILRMMMRDQKLKFLQEYPEMFAQLSVLRWDNDNARGDKIYMISKRKLRLKSNSDLDDEPFSKSPDMADSVALACLGYALLMQRLAEESEAVEEGPDMIPPTILGMFDIGQIGLEEAGI